jgi:hypothetical protein
VLWAQRREGDKISVSLELTAWEREGVDQ